MTPRRTPRRRVRPSPAPPRGTSNLAAIDVGTNSFHMVVAAVDSRTGAYTILDREKERVRLGEGSGDMKHLSAAAMDRGLAALRRFRAIADRFDASVTAVATSAVREAANRDEFILRVARETGIRLEVVSGVEEARLVYLGVLQALPVLRRKILLVDLGGGSTEFLIGRNRKVLYDNSLKVGAIRMTERFFPGGVTSEASVREARRFLRGILAPVRREVRSRGAEIAVGTSGTILTVAAMIREAAGEPPAASLNALVLRADEILETAAGILALRRPAERERRAGIDPSRSDIIAGGAVVLEQIVRELGIRELAVSEAALREGIIRDAAEKSIFHAGTPGLHDIRLSSVRHLVRKLRCETGHADQVAALALALFDRTQGIHRMGSWERELLEAAALLHEAGLFISHERHHQHSYYLVRNAELLGFREDEKEIIANVARYHRKSHPKAKHGEYARLGGKARAAVRGLSAILRIADGLDRTHSRAVADLRVSARNGLVRIRALARGDASIELELWGANRKKELFEEEFGARVEIEG